MYPNTWRVEAQDVPKMLETARNEEGGPDECMASPCGPNFTPLLEGYFFGLKPFGDRD